jgi:hypothetical protein
MEPPRQRFGRFFAKFSRTARSGPARVPGPVPGPVPALVKPLAPALVKPLVLALAVAGSAAPAAAWTPRFQVKLAEEAVRLAPPDLARQIERHGEELRTGVLDPFRDPDPLRHVQNGEGQGRLRETVLAETERAVELIRELAPFGDVVRQLGRVSHYVADLHNPLNCTDRDPREAEYYADYLRYAETAEPRFPLVFYGFRQPFDGPGDVRAMVDEALAHGRRQYPMVGREYRRIGFGSGVGAFDDRSTAFGVASVAFSRAASDIAQVLRYIWLRAGGADQRSALPERGGDPLVRVPRLGSGQGSGGIGW